MTFYYASMTSTVTYGKFFKDKKSFCQPQMYGGINKRSGSQAKNGNPSKNVKVKKIKTDLNLAEFTVIVGSQSGKTGLKFDAYKQF